MKRKEALADRAKHCGLEAVEAGLVVLKAIDDPWAADVVFAAIQFGYERGARASVGSFAKFCLLSRRTMRRRLEGLPTLRQLIAIGVMVRIAQELVRDGGYKRGRCVEVATELGWESPLLLSGFVSRWYGAPASSITDGSPASVAARVLDRIGAEVAA